MRVGAKVVGLDCVLLSARTPTVNWTPEGELYRYGVSPLTTWLLAVGPTIIILIVFSDADSEILSIKMVKPWATANSPPKVPLWFHWICISRAPLAVACTEDGRSGAAIEQG